MLYEEPLRHAVSLCDWQRGGKCPISQGILAKPAVFLFVSFQGSPFGDS